MAAISFPFISLLLLLFIGTKTGKALLTLWIIFLLVFIVNTTQDIIEANNRIDELWESLDR